MPQKSVCVDAYFLLLLPEFIINGAWFSYIEDTINTPCCHAFLLLPCLPPSPSLPSPSPHPLHHFQSRSESGFIMFHFRIIIIKCFRNDEWLFERWFLKSDVTFLQEEFFKPILGILYKPWNGRKKEDDMKGFKIKGQIRRDDAMPQELREKECPHCPLQPTPCFPISSLLLLLPAPDLFPPPLRFQSCLFPLQQKRKFCLVLWCVGWERQPLSSQPRRKVCEGEACLSSGMESAH